jgi:hypothetical protein
MGEMFIRMSEPKLYWTHPDWQKQAHDWIQAETERQSIHVTGEIEQPHMYPWSTVLRVPTSAGMLFFKATAAETIYESALTERLAGWYPGCMPELVAVDATRGWMLMRDGGEQLRAAIRPTRDVTPWNPVITRYAEVQIGLVGHVIEMLALGVPDHRLAALPALYTQLLKDEESLRIDQEKGLTSEEWEQLKAMRPRFEQICSELAGFEIPESLNHGDFHDGNVLIRDGHITFFDWGDASLTHPFVSLRTLFVSVEIALDLDDYSLTPEMMDLLEHYLEPWQKFASKDALLDAYSLSRPVASIVKALSWYKTISPLAGALRDNYAHIVPAVLQEFMVYEKMLSSK